MKLTRMVKWTALGAVVVFVAGANVRAQSLWDLAQRNKQVLKVSTLMTAQDVRDRLSSDQGIDDAIDWCKKTGVTHIFLEEFRDGYTAQRPAVEHARDRFRAAGLEVSGCVTTTKVGKDSTGWKSIACYTDEPTQKHIQEIFEYAASMFDEIMIDDFWFTDCQCPECQKARGDKSWAQYRCDLMVQVSRDRILKPAKAVNPKVKVIIKYPQWYAEFHNRGYEVVRETADFDRIWVGTETRDPDNDRWGKKAQYEAYFIMRWLGQIGGAKCGGGWFDPYGTHEDTYVEQARQTVLGGAHEMLLFCYGSLLRDTGPANVAKLRTELPGLFELARLIRDQPLRGIAAPKPPNSDEFDEQYVYDFVGMLGLPLIPTDEVRTDVKAAFLPVQTLKDPQLSDKLNTMLRAGTPVLVTDGLARRFPGRAADDKNLLVLKVNGNPRGLLDLTREQLKPIRDKLLAPLGIRFDAPNKVALYLFGDHCVAVENFNDEATTASLGISRVLKLEQALVLPVNGSVMVVCNEIGQFELMMAPRTLVVFEY
jgi:hypothetical protein